MRTIDADALKVAMYKRATKMLGTRVVCEVIDNAPTIELERPQGEWILYTGNGKKEYQCSICSIKETNPKLARFCYWCGAKMQGGEV